MNHSARHLLLDRLADTQARLASNLGPDVHRRTRAALLRRIAGDLTAVHVVLATEHLPGRPSLPRSVEVADALLAAAGVHDDGFMMPRCRAAVRQAARAALAEDGGRVSEPASAAAFLEAVIDHVATLRDLAEQGGNQIIYGHAVERHRLALVAFENLDMSPDPLAVPPLPSEAPAALTTT